MLLPPPHSQNDCLYVHLKFSPNPHAPRHEWFIQLQDEQVLGRTSITDFSTVREAEVQRILQAPNSGRHRTIVFETVYETHRVEENGDLRVIKDRCFLFQDIVLSGRKKTYTSADVEALHLSLRNLTTSPTLSPLQALIR